MQKHNYLRHGEYSLKNDNQKANTWNKRNLCLLLNLVKMYGNNWTKISENITIYSPLEIEQSYKNLKSQWNTYSWSEPEDYLLFNIPNEQNKIDWNERSITLGNRSPEECEKRWNKLKKKYVTIGTWTYDEQLLIFKMLKVHAFTWKAFRKEIPHRTTNAIKGLIHASLRKIKKMKTIFWCLYKFARWPTFTNKSKIQGINI